jgi:hypothetical protein
MLKKSALVITALLFVGLPALAEPLAMTVYGRKADLALLNKVSQIPSLNSMVQEMEQGNVKIYKVPRAIKADAQRSKTFDFLPSVPVEQAAKFEEKVADVQSEGALFVTQDEIPGASSNFILIANDAEPMTLLHEYIHHLFETQNHQETTKIGEMESEHNSFLRRFNFKTGKILSDRDLLASKLWRDEIKSLSEEYVESMESGQGIILAEEVAVETNLAKILIANGSPHFDIQRAHVGIDTYASGLVKLSESHADQILALNDVIRTDGISQDPEATDSERSDWSQRSKVMEVKLRTYINGPIASMKSQVRDAQKLLKALER